MNQHDVQRDHQQGAAQVEGQAGPEHEERLQQPDLAEHEAVVPSSVEDDLPGGPAEAATDTAEDAGDRAGAAIPPTGDDRVDAALSRLGELDRLDVTRHAEVVEDVHRALQDTLAEEEE